MGLEIPIFGGFKDDIKIVSTRNLLFAAVCRKNANSCRQLFFTYDGRRKMGKNWCSSWCSRRRSTDRRVNSLTLAPVVMRPSRPMKQD